MMKMNKLKKFVLSLFSSFKKEKKKLKNSIKTKFNEDDISIYISFELSKLKLFLEKEIELFVIKKVVKEAEKKNELN